MLDACMTTPASRAGTHARVRRTAHIEEPRMLIDQTKRPEGDEGEDLVVEELFVEDYGVPTPVEEVPSRGTMPARLKRRAHAMTNVVRRAPKRSMLGLIVTGLLTLAGILVARERPRR